MINKIEVNEITYHISQATAEQQLDVYEDIGARLLANCANTLTDEINVSVLHGLLLSAPKGTVPKIADAFLTKCFKEGSKEPVSIRDFQGDVNNYVLLVCHAMLVNLSDFFTYIESRVTEQKKEIEAKSKALESQL